MNTYTRLSREVMESLLLELSQTRSDKHLSGQVSVHSFLPPSTGQDRLFLVIISSLTLLWFWDWSIQKDRSWWINLLHHWTSCHPTVVGQSVANIEAAVEQLFTSWTVMQGSWYTKLACRVLYNVWLDYLYFSHKYRISFKREKNLKVIWLEDLFAYFIISIYA